MTRTRTYPWR